MARTALFCNLRSGSVYESNVCPQATMPYCKKAMKSALYSVINVVVESMCLTLKRIPQVFASFLESSAMWYFPLSCSSNKTPKNLIYFTQKMCFLPILIEILSGTELADEWNI